MAEVTVSINSRAFQIVCPDGEEAQVMRLAEDLSARVSEVRKGGVRASDSHMLVLTGLTLCSELRDIQRDLDALKSDITRADTAREELTTRLEELETTISNSLNTLATRLEKSL